MSYLGLHKQDSVDHLIYIRRICSQVGHCSGGTGAPVGQFPELSIVPGHDGAATEVVVTHWPPLYTAGAVHFGGVLAVVTQFPELSTVPEHGAIVEVVVTHWPPFAELYTAGAGHFWYTCSCNTVS